MMKSIFSLCVFAVLSCASVYSESVFTEKFEDRVSQTEAGRSGFLSYVAGSRQYFSLNPITDSVLIGSGIGLFAVDQFLLSF